MSGGSPIEVPVAPRRRRGASPWARKRLRTLVVLGGLFVLVFPMLLWRARLTGEVREQLAAVEAQGLPVTLAQLDARVPEVPEGENAARRYLEAAGLIQERRPLRSVVRPVVSGPLDPGQLAAARALVADNGPALAVLHEASRLRDSRYIERYAPGNRTNLGHLERLRPLALLLCSQALLHCEDENTEAALGALSDALALARSLRNDGLFSSLAERWEMERQVIETLERVLNAADPDPAVVLPFLEQVSVERREEQLARMLETEQGLFIARVREGRRRGLFRSIVLSAGIGDLNIRAYLSLSRPALQWPGAEPALRPTLESEYAQIERQYEKRPLLFVTTLSSRPSATWTYFKEELDRAAVAQAGLAAYLYRRSTGRLPERLEELVPGYLPELPVLSSPGAPLVIVVTPGQLEVTNGVEGAGRIAFTVANQS